MVCVYLYEYGCLGCGPAPWVAKEGMSLSEFNIEDKLRNYKKNRAEVNTTLQRIAVWQEMLRDGDMSKFVNAPSITPGMPKAPIRQSSPVERIIEETEVTAELVQQWIEDEKSRIFLIKLEVEQIEEAMNALNAEQKYIIDKKYFEGWQWRTIEINFNEEFKHRPAIYERGLRFINKEALEILTDILTPLYMQFKVV